MKKYLLLNNGGLSGGGKVEYPIEVIGQEKGHGNLVVVSDYELVRVGWDGDTLHGEGFGFFLDDEIKELS